MHFFSLVTLSVLVAVAAAAGPIEVEKRQLSAVSGTACDKIELNS